MGTSRKPTTILQLQGAYKNHPERKKDRAGEPKDIAPLGSPPESLNADEVKTWNELENQCAAGVLTIMDRQILEIATRLMTRFRGKNKKLSSAELNTLVRSLSLMGMTPSDRSRLNVHPNTNPGGDGWDNA